MVQRNKGRLRTKYEELEVLIPNVLESLPYIKLKRWVQVDSFGNPILQEMKLTDDLLNFGPKERKKPYERFSDTYSD